MINHPSLTYTTLQRLGTLPRRIVKLLEVLQKSAIKDKVIEGSKGAFMFAWSCNTRRKRCYEEGEKGLELWGFDKDIEAYGGKAHDLGSIWEETGQECNSTGDGITMFSEDVKIADKKKAHRRFGGLTASRNPSDAHAIDHSVGGNLCDKSAKESWELIENLAPYDHESWNDPRDFAKLVKAISLPQDVPNASDRRLVELENQVQRLMEAHLSPKPFVQVNKITSSCEICGGPHDTQYCMKNHEQAFVDYASSCIDEARESLELGKNGSTFVQGEKPKKIKDLGLFTLPCRPGDSKPFDTLSDLGSCVNLIPLYLFKKLKIRLLKKTETILGLADGRKSYPVGILRNIEVYVGKLKLLEDFYVIYMEKDPTCPLLVGRGFLATASVVIDCKKAKIAVGEGITFRVKEIDLGHVDIPYWTTLAKQKSYEPGPSTNGIGAKPPYYMEKDFMDNHLPEEWEIFRDAELNPFKDVLLIEKKIDWNKPSKEGDGVWHIKIELIDLDGEKFDRIFQSIPTTRKLFEKETPSDILDLEHFYDS
ncbi:MAK10-like protein [Tanacetum coccineum]